MRVNPSYKRRLSVPMKITIVICCLIIVMTAVFLLRETKLIRGYRDFLRRSVNSIKNRLDGTDKNIEVDGRIYESDNFDIIDKRVPFKIDKPGWMPEGYVLEKTRYIEFITHQYSIDYTFVNPDSNIEGTSFVIYTVVYDIEPTIIADYEIVEINGTDVYIMSDIDSDNVSCLYLNNQGLTVYIYCPLGKETLIKIIENMD